MGQVPEIRARQDLKGRGCKGGGLAFCSTDLFSLVRGRPFEQFVPGRRSSCPDFVSSKTWYDACDGWPAIGILINQSQWVICMHCFTQGKPPVDACILHEVEKITRGCSNRAFCQYVSEKSISFFIVNDSNSHRNPPISQSWIFLSVKKLPNTGKKGWSSTAQLTRGWMPVFLRCHNQ